MVRCDAVAHFYHCHAVQVGRHCAVLRRLAYVRPAHDGRIRHLRRREYEHGIIDQVGFRLRDLRVWHAEGPRIGELPRYRCDCCCLRACQVDLCVLGAGAPLEVAVRRPHGDTHAPGREVIAHAEAAGRFHEASARSYQVGQSTVPHEHPENLAGARRDAEADAWMDPAPFEDCGSDHKVMVRRIGARPYADLIDGHGADVQYPGYIAGAVGQADERLKRGQIDVDDALVPGVSVRREGLPVGFAALGFQKGPRHFV